MTQRHAWAVTVLLLCACEGSVDPMADAGFDASAGDAGVATVCARESDCDNGAFCDGVERCMPGEPGSDARGCVPGASPCEDACDEAGDRCGECVNADDDGHLPIACGGDDCDDTDGNRFPGNPEICDVANHDEDCDRDTVGPDLDEDGHEDPRCCAMWDDELVCGTDCDDGDPAINPERDEICNGRDDDCNGTIDDGFECAADQSVMGTNACGNEGMRRCSATCAWLDADYYLTEARSTCDYCSDNGMGLGDEIAFADGRFTIGNGWFDDHLFGGAVPMPLGSGIRIANGGNGSAVAMAFGRPLTMGYGGILVEANVRVSATGTSPQGGWGLSVFRAAPGAEFIGGRFGIPQDRSGFSVEWRFFTEDQIELMQMRSDEGSIALAPPVAIGAPEFARFPGADGEPVFQRISMLITLDRPDTAYDEFEIVAHAIDSDGLRRSVACSNMPGATFPCGPALQVGELVYVAVSGHADRCQIILEETSGTMGSLCSDS